MYALSYVTATVLSSCVQPTPLSSTMNGRPAYTVFGTETNVRLTK